MIINIINTLEILVMNEYIISPDHVLFSVTY